MTGIKVGEYFLEKGLISESDISLALNFQKNHPTYLGEILLKLGKIPETELLQYLSKQFNVQYITSEKLEKMAVMTPSDVIPLKIAMDKTIFPLKYSVNNYRLTLLTYEPQNIVLFDELKILLNGVHSVVPVVATSNVIKALILKQYNNDITAFDRLVRNSVSMHHDMFANETIISLDNPNDVEIANRIQDIATMDEDKLRQEKRETFSMIVNQAELSDNKVDVTSVTTSMMSNMPSWVREQGNQLIELLRIFSNLLDVAAHGDTYFAHSQRVAILCKEIGEAIHLSEVEIYDLTIAAYLHDVGKKIHLTALDIKNQTNTEKMKTYPQIVTKLFADVQLSKLALNCLENMYETYNGQGLPRGLKLNEIPVGSLILLLANTYDFMTRISGVSPKDAFKQLKETMFFSDRILNALEQTQQISEANSSLKKITAVVISQKKFDLDDIADKFGRINIDVIKAKTIEKAAQIIKEEKDHLGFILCDIDMTDTAITPLRLLAAIKHKKEISEIPFYFFSQYSVDKNTTIAANALKVSGIFANYHPVDMTRKIADEIRKKI